MEKNDTVEKAVYTKNDLILTAILCLIIGIVLSTFIIISMDKLNNDKKYGKINSTITHERRIQTREIQGDRKAKSSELQKENNKNKKDSSKEKSSDKKGTTDNKKIEKSETENVTSSL